MKSFGAIDGDDGQRYNNIEEGKSTSAPNELLTVLMNSSILLHHKTFFRQSPYQKAQLQDVDMLYLLSEITV